MSGCGGGGPFESGGWFVDRNSDEMKKNSVTFTAMLW